MKSYGGVLLTIVLLGLLLFGGCKKEVGPLVEIKVWLSDDKLHVFVQEGSLLAAGDKIIRTLTPPRLQSSKGTTSPMRKSLLR